MNKTRNIKGDKRFTTYDVIEEVLYKQSLIFKLTNIIIKSLLRDRK